jgi:hypothetical protein
MRTMIVLAALLAAAAAQAAEPSYQAPGVRSGPGALDINGDGLITPDEAQTRPRLAARFGDIDANKDGQLDAGEMNAHRERIRAEQRVRAEARWKDADKDGDGLISRDESAAMPRMSEHFDRLDADTDGRVSREEMRQSRDRYQQQRKQQHRYQRQEQSQRVR